MNILARSPSPPVCRVDSIFIITIVLSPQLLPPRHGAAAISFSPRHISLFLLLYFPLGSTSLQSSHPLYLSTPVHTCETDPP